LALLTPILERNSYSVASSFLTGVTAENERSLQQRNTFPAQSTLLIIALYVFGWPILQDQYLDLQP